jgi:glycerol uptake facilitator-like aquaporin
MKDKVANAVTFWNDIMDALPPGLFIVLALAWIEGGKYFPAFRHELIGSMLMIGFTFSAGKWVGESDFRVAWACHSLGVVLADKIGGGPNVNPAMTVTMWCLGKLSYTEGIVRIAGQMAGGLVAFPLFHALSEALELTPFGGPEFNSSADEFGVAEAALSEFFATICLCFAIYFLNFEFNFGSHHYIIKQTLTAVSIRALIEIFPTAGPAMNPMLATAWAAFGVGDKFDYPDNFEHYFVYWVSPFAASVIAAFLYTIYAGGKFLGVKLPVGPIKPQPEPVVSKKKKKN